MGGIQMNAAYDPFARGPFAAGVCTFQARDTTRQRLFPCEIWYPSTADYAGRDLAPSAQDEFALPTGETQRQSAVRDAAVQPGVRPLILFSHHSGGHRRASSFLCTHLAGHGYIVAVLDHSEVVAPELGRRDGETPAQLAARVDSWIANRVPDIRFLLDYVLGNLPVGPEASVDTEGIGMVGYSFGGWTSLAALNVEPRIRAVAALAPGGSSHRRPGIIPATLDFKWTREVATLYLVAELDTCLPLYGMHEIFERTPAPKQMVVLRRADHLHFIDNVEQSHEGFRTMPAAGDLAKIQEEMRPIAELCSGEQAHLFLRGLTLAHFDDVLRRQDQARRFLDGDIEAELAVRGVEAVAYEP